ncbi:MAG: ArnT family glycosyltransferase [Shewanella sp.]
MHFASELYKRTLDSDNYGKVLTLLLLFATIIIFTGIGLRSPWPADEPRFAEVAREMVSTGNWLIPMRGGEAYPDKPPVFMWAIALFYWLSGNLKIAFLLPNALCSLLTLFLVFDLGTRLWNIKTARNAALLLLLFPQFIIQAKVAQIDAMVTAWITLGCYGLLRHFLLGPNWKWYFIAWGMMGLGIITKGVGFLPVFLLLPIAAYQLAGKKISENTFTRKGLYGPAVMLGVIALWLVPMLLYVWINGSQELIQYRNNILFKQTGERYVNAWHHIEPWYYYLLDVIPGLWFPALLLIVAYAKKIVSAIRMQPQIAILFCWVICVLAFFSLSPGKRGVYILPALPMFSLALAASITPFTQVRWFERLLSVILWGLGGAMVLTGILALARLPALTKAITTNLNAIALLVILIGALWLTIQYLLRKKSSMLRMGASMSMTWLLISLFGYPLLEPMRTPEIILKNAEKITGPGGELGLINFKEQFILFSPLNITHFSYLAPVEQQERNGWQWMQEGEHRYLIVRQNQPLSCINTAQGQMLGKAHGDEWVLISKQDLTPDCEKPTHRELFFTPKPAAWLNL